MYDRKRPRKYYAVFSSNYTVSREDDYAETIWARTKEEAWQKAREIRPSSKSLMSVSRASTGRRR